MIQKQINTQNEQNIAIKLELNNRTINIPPIIYTNRIFTKTIAEIDTREYYEHIKNHDYLIKHIIKEITLSSDAYYNIHHIFLTGECNNVLFYLYNKRLYTSYDKIILSSETNIQNIIPINEYMLEDSKDISLFINNIVMMICFKMPSDNIVKNVFNKVFKNIKEDIKLHFKNLYKYKTIPDIFKEFKIYLEN
jgi:hypothetical protein